MRINLNPIVRVSFGLLMLTLSIVFVAEWLGLIPHQRELELEQRKQFSETLAVQFTSLAQAGGNQHIRTTLTALVRRDRDIESAAFRALTDDTFIEVGDHVDNWELTEDDEYSTSDQVIVPIYRGDERWGSLEIRFAEPPTVWYSLFSRDSFVSLVAFLTISGFILYFLFLRRVMRELDPRRAVPERVKAAFNSLAEGVVILDEESRMILTNSAFTDIAALNPKELVGKTIDKLNWSAYKSEAALASDNYPWSKVIAEASPIKNTRLTLNRNSDIEKSFALNCTPIMDGGETVRGVIVTFDDLTELEKKNEALSATLTELKQTQADVTQKNIELQQLATKDPLTNCLNRRAFTEQYQTLFEQAVKTKGDLVCIMADIDHFKRINDNYGHSVGDKVIKFVAETLRRQLRKDDLLGRYGGEEFCIVLDGLDLAEASEVAERMRKEIINGDPTLFTAALRVTASFGLATIHDETQSQDELVNKADKALYLSKEGGRNKITCWEEQPDTLADAAPDGDTSAPALAPVLQHPASLAATAGDDAGDRIRRLEAIAAERAEQFDRYVAYDQATQLPFRSLFIDRVEQALLRARRDSRVLAVLSLGLANLKRINDTLGHDAAQEVMRETSERLQSVLRDTDTVSLMAHKDDQTTISKLSDGEFGLLLPSVEDPESITWIVKRIFDVLGEPMYIDDHHIAVESNVGIGVFPNDSNDPLTLLKHASISRYYAEQQPGHHHVEFYSDQINSMSREQLRLESELSRAVDAGEFRVVFQPKIDLSMGNITGFEALLRWQHPEKGLLTPNEFIEIAERTRLINLIGEWVLRESCIQIRKLSEACGRQLTIAVNLSPVQSTQSGLVGRVMEILEETDTDPSTLELELTESCLMDNFETTFQSLATLQSIGVHISIDDFGTGYSGLSYLRRLPVDTLKIDRSFVADINSSEHDKTIVAAIIQMAKALGLTVVAEGVETRTQLALLTEMRCDEAQGYLFSRPVSVDKAEELLMATNAWGEVIYS